MFSVLLTTILALILMVTLAFIRMKKAENPTSKRKILLPPLFMSTGGFMFVFPYFRISIYQAVEALLLGLIFSSLLIYTSKLEIRNKKIYLIPSRAFFFIMVGLILIRSVAKLIIGSQTTLGETAGIFFLLGFGMIFSWRLAMLLKYIQLNNQIKKMH